MAGVDPYLRIQLDHLLDNRFPEGFESADALGEVKVPIIFKVTDLAEAFEAVIVMPDIEIVTILGSIFFCIGSALTLDELMSSPLVLIVEASRSATLVECGQSVPFTKASQVHSNIYEEKGNYAVVAVIDNGIDPFHGAFIHPNGNSRVHAYWDQTSSNAPKSRGLSFGTVYYQADINRILKSSAPNRRGIFPKDCFHGTHVASIAAGGPTSKFAGGMAPESTIVAVRVRNSSEYGGAGEIISAIRFILDVAEFIDLPLVVNLSLGISGGARDGTSLLEQAIDEVTSNGNRPGRIFVTSAGNQAGKDGHSNILLNASSKASISWEIYSGAGGLFDVVEFWLDPRAEIACEVLYDGRRVTGLFCAGQQTPDIVLPDGNRMKIVFLSFHHSNGLSYLLVSVGNQHNQTAKQVQVNFLNESGFDCEIHGWADHTSTSSIKFLNHVSDLVSLTSPAAALSIVSVTACSASTTPVLNLDSSRGPTRDKREKPDLTAPGDQVFGAAANSQHQARIESGSSQAAAHVTGAVALLLSVYEKMSKSQPTANLKSLTARQVQSALRISTQYASAGWDTGFGSGVLDTAELIRRVTGVES